MARVDRFLTAGAALLLAALGFLPLVNWIPGGPAAEWYGSVAGEWVSGTALVLGTGLLLALASRRVPALWPARLSRWYQAAAARPGTALLIAVLAGGLYAVVARIVFDGKPLLIDEIIQTWHGRLLAEGRLWNPVPAHPEFTSSMHLIDAGDKLFGQFPVGGPAMLAVGSLLGAEWLVGPLFGALAVALFGVLARRTEPRPGVALGAVLLFALAPFAVFMSGSHMNHVTGLCWILLGAVGLSAATSETGGRFRDGLLAGIGLGVSVTVRPVDAMAFALPAGIWLLWRAVRHRRVAALLGSGLGIAIPGAILLWANSQTTGDPFTLGYTVMWGAAHDLGFHATPWGEVHTPVRGFELVNLYFLRLQSYLFEAPIPSLVPAGLALALTRRLSPMDRYLLVSAALVCAAYFAYWHDGFYLGPRFLYPLLPVLALWTARALPALRERMGASTGYRTAVYGTIVAVLLALAAGVTVRATEYRAGMQSPRWDADRAARAAGIRNSLIFVRESWGAEVMARLWAVGVPRSDAEEFYRRIDTCRLDEAVTRLERQGTRGGDAVASLRPLLADSARVQKTTISPDPTERVVPGRPYSARCEARVRENWNGFTLYSPLLLAGQDGNLFVRDLHARDTLMLALHPDRPVYLLRRASYRITSPFVFDPVNRDSLWRTAREAP
jgi:hypothetical protein